MDKFNKNIFTEMTVVKSNSNMIDNKLSRKINQVVTVLASKKINLTELQNISWTGLPNSHRADVWKLLLEYLPTNAENTKSTLIRKRQEYKDTCLIYNDLLENPINNMTETEYKMYKQIQVDIPRTMTEYKLFTFEIIRKMLLRILYVWSKRHPASGYVQGFNDLLTPFIAVFCSEYVELNIDDPELNIEENQISSLSESTLLAIEADSYWCFKKMMDKIQTNYINGHPGLQHMLSKMQNIINIVDKDLIHTLKKFDLKFIDFSFRWMNCYLMREFNLRLIVRLWDAYFSLDDAFNSFHLFVCACLLLNFSEELKKLTEYQDIIMFLQKLPLDKWGLEEMEMLLAKSYQIYSLYRQLIMNNK